MFRRAPRTSRAADVLARATDRLRTAYCRSRYRGVALFGRGCVVRGPLRLAGPGRIVVGDGCVLGSRGVACSIRVAALVTVRFGDGCHVDDLDVSADADVTIGARVKVTGRLRIGDCGRVVVGDDVSATVLEVVRSGRVSVGAGTHVFDHLHIERCPDALVGPRTRINALDITSAGRVEIGAGVNVRSRAHIGGEGDFALGDACTVESGGLDVHTESGDAAVRIGIECGLNGLDVYATDDVTIGDRCMVGSCSMMTTDFHSTRSDRWSPQAPVKRGKIVVGDNVWLANRTVIVKAVTIGPNSVVSIGTVVRRDVPANVIVASHEQRIVKHLRPPAQGED